MKVGAFDYLPKPFTPDEMAAVAAQGLGPAPAAAAQPRRAAARRATTRPCSPASSASSPTMQEVYRNLRKVASTSSTVLIIGETGTGKELVARAIHNAEPAREHERFFAVDCGAPARRRCSSRELFGHVKGAFTGRRPRQARASSRSPTGGTVFLDEIGNVDARGRRPSCCAFIQEREFLPVGAHAAPARGRAARRRHQPRPREDGARGHASGRTSTTACNVFPIQLPPLRERREDIPLLACHLLAKSRETLREAGRAASPKTRSKLLGPVRLARKRPAAGSLRRARRDRLRRRRDRAAAPAENAGPPDRCPPTCQIPTTNREFLALKKRLREQAVIDLEREFVLESRCSGTGGTSRAAAAEVGIQRPNFQMLMRRHGIQGEAWRRTRGLGGARRRDERSRPKWSETPIIRACIYPSRHRVRPHTGGPVALLRHPACRNQAVLRGFRLSLQ
ncbi:MAG: sigma 54-interacting transcriptional regulator [Desulfobacterales bacterium]|nr:sigma 54-interacting transcriptional regulator [Desulfobacterales bacterium]